MNKLDIHFNLTKPIRFALLDTIPVTLLNHVGDNIGSPIWFRCNRIGYMMIWETVERTKTEQNI